MYIYLWFVGCYNRWVWIENRTSEKLTLVNDTGDDGSTKRVNN